MSAGPVTRATLRLVRGRGWYVELEDGQTRADALDAFGTARLPLPLGDVVPLARAMAHIRECFPGAAIDTGPDLDAAEVD